MTIVCAATPNFGHFYPMSRIAIALQERGHTVHVISCDCERGRNAVPKTFEGTGVQFHLTKLEGDLEIEYIS